MYVCTVCTIPKGVVESFISCGYFLALTLTKESSIATSHVPQSNGTVLVKLCGLVQAGTEIQGSLHDCWQIGQFLMQKSSYKIFIVQAI